MGGRLALCQDENMYDVIVSIPHIREHKQEQIGHSTKPLFQVVTKTTPLQCGLVT